MILNRRTFIKIGSLFPFVLNSNKFVNTNTTGLIFPVVFAETKSLKPNAVHIKDFKATNPLTELWQLITQSIK